MKFKVGDDVIQPHIRQTVPFASRSTGRELRRLSIEFRTGDATAQERIDACQSGAVLVGIDETPPSRWRKVGTSSSMNDGKTSHWLHTWELEEVEQLTPSALVIGDLRVQPDRYAEHWAGERLEVLALVTLNAEEDTATRKKVAAEEPVPVVRVGISDIPRQMDILKGPWSERAGRVRRLLRLEDPQGKSDQRPTAGVLELGRTYNSVPYLLGLVDELGALLVSKGVVSDEELKSLKKMAVEKYPERALDMLRVDNVEDYWSDET